MKDYETLVKDIIQEENELKDKINRLEYFMMTEDYQKISERQQILLTQQLAAMNNYKGCLISRVLQLRFEHEENKGKTCEPEPEKKAERLEPHVFAAMEYEAHRQKANVREGPKEEPNKEDCVGCRYYKDSTNACTNRNKKDGKCWEASY